MNVSKPIEVGTIATKRLRSRGHLFVVRAVQPPCVYRCIVCARTITRLKLPAIIIISRAERRCDFRGPEVMYTNASYYNDWGG